MCVCVCVCGWQWKQTNALVEVGAWYGNEITRNVRLDLNNPGCNLASTDADVRGMCLGDCPSRSTDNIWDEGIVRTNTGCVNTAPQFDAIGTEDSNGNGDQGENFYIRFPPVMQTNGQPIVVCPEYAHPLSSSVASHCGPTQTAHLRRTHSPIPRSVVAACGRD